MPTDYTDSRFKFDFEGKDGTAYRLIMVTGQITDLSDPAVTPIDFPTSILVNSNFQSDWGYTDKYSIGMLNEGVIKLTLDLTDLTGAYDSDADFWDCVRDCIMEGQSTAEHATINNYIPNRWTLLSGATYATVEFDGFQVYNPEGKLSISNQSIEFEVTIVDSLSSVLKTIKPYFASDGLIVGTGGSTLTYATATAGQYVFDLVYTYNSNEIRAYKKNPSDRIPYYTTHANLWSFLRAEIQRYLQAFCRDSTVTFNTNITKPKTLNDSNELSYITLYKQDITSIDIAGGSLNNDTEVLVYVKRTNLSGNTDYGLLVSRSDPEGWGEYESLLDVFRYLTEGMLCKMVTDLNPATGVVSLGFFKIFERTLGTTQKVIENTGYDDGDSCSVATNEVVDLEFASRIVEGTTHYGSAVNNSINQYSYSIPKTHSEDSYEVQCLWQNNYSAIDAGKVSFTPYESNDSMAINHYNHLSCRNLYYTESTYSNNRLKIHENLTIDLGDSTTVSQSADPSFLPRNTTSSWSVEAKTPEQWNKAQMTSCSASGFLVVCAKAIIEVCGNRDQLMFKCTVDKATADHSMLGDIYNIDLDSFVANGSYLSSKYGNMAILVNTTVDYMSGTTEAVFWITGRTI